MAFIPAPDTLGVQIVGQLDEQVWENTLYFQYHDAVTTEVLNDLGGLVRDWFITDMLSHLSASMIFTKVIVTDLHVADGLQVEVTDSLPANGAISGECMPNQVALVAAFLTGHRGRSYRGRNYLTGLPVASVDGNYINTGEAVYFQSKYEFLRDNLVTDGYEWSVVSKYSGGAPRTSAVVTPITGVRIDPVVGNMRRRKPGVGS